jgi:hypothetical protein
MKPQDYCIGGKWDALEKKIIDAIDEVKNERK